MLLSTVVTPPNAADLWGDFFEQIQDIELPIGEQSDWGSSEQAMYEEFLPLIRQARSNAQVIHCDWGLNYSKGMDLLLPHLSPMRQAAGLIQFSVQADLVSGNNASAIDGMSSIVGISQQSSTDKTVIGSLVGYSAFSMTKGFMSAIDSAYDPMHLEGFKQRLDAIDTFDPFAIRASVGHERDSLISWFDSPQFKALDPSDFGSDVNASSWHMDTEIKNYNEAMDKAIRIFAIEDQETAVDEMNEWESALTSGQYGEMSKVLCPSMGRLLENAFKATDDIATLKSLVNKKIEMLQSPNSATYFIQAVQAYEAIDPEERAAAVGNENFEILEVSLQLLAKAAAMEPARITLAEDPATPYWIAPLHALTLDGIARGSSKDILVALQVVGHFSQQDRFAASISAANLFDLLHRSKSHLLSIEDTNRFKNAIRRIPHADAFMLHASAKSDARRLADWFKVDGDWQPSEDVVLATTITLAVKERLPIQWEAFVKSLGVPDNDAVIKAAISTQASDAILLVELHHAKAFSEKLRYFQRLLATLK
ncbi:MAG: hypothetical protein VX436_01670 [Planctomycetota bacterium]|nr:hypothetical protein [Planctomycetota bacterium]